MNQIAMRGGIVMAAAQLAKAFLQFSTIVVLAHILQPGDFGLVAIVAPLTAFVLLFQDLGMQQMLIQRPIVTQPVVSYVFWMTAAVGLGCALLVLLASPFVATFFGDARLRNLTALSAFLVFGGSLCSSPIGMLNRALRFNMIACITAGAAFAALATALIAALLGAGYWSLMLAPVASTIVTLAASWSVSGLAPGSIQLRQPETGMLSFGANLTGFSVMNYFARNLDNILIGRYVGNVALGFYDQAYKLLLFPLVTVNTPLAQVMVPLLSKVQADKARLRSAYLRVLAQLVMLIVPGVAAMAITSSDLIGLLFGNRWAPVAPIFAWLGMAGLIQPVNNSTGWIFISQARTHIMLRWGALSSTIAVLSFVVGLPWGAQGVATAYALSEYLRAPLLYAVVQHVGPVSALDLLRIQIPPLFAALCTYATMRWGFDILLPQHGVSHITVALLTSYAFTTALMSFRPEGRAALREGAALLALFWRRTLALGAARA